MHFVIPLRTGGTYSSLRFTFCAILLISLVTPSTARGNNNNPHLKGGPNHPLPVRPPGMPFAPTPSNAHLTYFGGRVCSNLKVVQVLYGSGNYLPNVSNTTSPSISTFYAGVLNSSYLDWLSEYDTNITAAGGSAGTNQRIGRGAFVGQFLITPSAANSGPPLDDSQIQSELAAQIIAGNLPEPTTDLLGNINTYYAVFFPHGVSITLNGSSSCVVGGFCAYHGTIANVNGHEIYYGVHPDFQAGSGCDTGCGAGTTFEDTTSAASHEMVETITDPEVGLATNLAPPLAWDDPTNGEIGDICNQQQAPIIGADGVTYTVQKAWSNSAGACIVNRPDTDGDGIPDAIDNCPFTPNGPLLGTCLGDFPQGQALCHANSDCVSGKCSLNQEDSGGVGTGSAPDGIGDACQCGDVNNDGLVTATDSALINRALAALSPYTSVSLLPGFAKCDVLDTTGKCTVSDAVVINRALAALGPGVKQTCTAAVCHSPEVMNGVTCPVLP